MAAPGTKAVEWTMYAIEVGPSTRVSEGGGGSSTEWMAEVDRILFGVYLVVLFGLKGAIASSFAALPSFLQLLGVLMSYSGRSLGHSCVTLMRPAELASRAEGMLAGE